MRKSLLLICLILGLSNIASAKWEPCNNGLNGKRINTMTVYNDTLYIGSAGQGVFISVDNGNSWQARNNGMDTLMVRSIVVNESLIFASTNYFGIFMSTDRGLSWVKKNNGLLDSTISTVIIKDKELICATSYYGVFTSSDNGDNWVQKTKGLANEGMMYVNPLVLINDTIFTGVQSRYSDPIQGGLFLSNDNCETWIDRTGNNLSDFMNIKRIIIKDNIWYIGTLFGGVYTTTDKGSTWTLPDTTGLNIPLGNPRVSAMGMKDDFLIIGSGYNGLFAKFENKWVNKSYGTKFRNPGSITFYKEFVYVTSDSGVHRSVYNQLLDVKEFASNFDSVSISPNPTSDFIEISVGAIGRSPLQSAIKIYNIFGQNCDPTPALPASREGARIDVSGLVPGMYFVRIGDRVGKFVKI